MQQNLLLVLFCVVTFRSRGTKSDVLPGEAERDCQFVFAEFVFIEP